jgi:carboxynorspermidine decarboxylase
MNKDNLNFNNKNFDALPTPCFIVDERLLLKNLEILSSVIKSTGCKILLAQKAFSMFSLYPLIGKYLNGTTASSLFEAKLGREEMGNEVHIYSPAYIEAEFNEIISVCDHVVFNSISEINKFRPKITAAKKAGKHIEIGLRLNPEYSEIKTDLYNPCFPNSRFGILKKDLKSEDFEGVDGIHFHTMCEQNSDVLERTLPVFEEKFSEFLSKVHWVNFGGGHHITRPDYDVEKLINIISRFKNKYGVDVYLEPGEAVALNTGFLVSKVLTTLKNNMDIAILDTSAACHMPDVLEMPYRPQIIGAGNPNEFNYTYRLGGPTCLAGDVIGDYSFKEPLNEGDTLIFTDMAHYTMVKNNTFNGINLPSIASYNENEGIKLIKKFGYNDFKSRLS